jgi:two-component system NarL family response regulator
MRLLLVDDNTLFVDALRRILELHDFVVAGTAVNAAEAVAVARELHPDVVLMDIEMPGGSGIEATRALKALNPDMKIVMMTVSGDDKSLFDALAAGASGYLLKSMTEEELLETLDKMTMGEAPLTAGLTARIIGEFARREQSAGKLPDEHFEALSERQIEILKMVAQGYTYSQIAHALGLSEVTIRYHMNAIARQLHLKNRSQVIACASRYLVDNSHDSHDS